VSTYLRRTLLSMLAAAVVGGGLGLACSRCLLDVTPDPYVPPALVIQGTKPIMDGGADD